MLFRGLFDLTRRDENESETLNWDYTKLEHKSDRQNECVLIQQRT